MKNPFEKIFRNKNTRRGLAVAAAITAAAEGVEAQTNRSADQEFLKNLKPEWEIDMTKYPGMHPSKAFEIEGYNKLDLPGKIQWTKDAIEAEKRNLKIDTEMGEGEEQIKKDKEEIRKLKQQLLDLERQGQPSV